MRIQRPERKKHRFSALSSAGIFALALIPAALTASTVSADPAPESACSAAEFDAGTCLMGIQTPGKSPLTAAVQAAVRSGRSDVVDKFAAQATTSEAMKSEIAAARVDVSPVLEVIDQHVPTDSPNPGITPFGGSDGSTTTYTWTMQEERPIVRCESAGCYQVDIIDISFNLDLYTNNTAIMYGEFKSRDGIGQFGVKNITCQVKADLPYRPDPIRGSFSSCIGAPRTTWYTIHESSVSHSYYDEENWVNIKFESYDANVGISFGTVEYKSPNWTKTSTGDQHF